MFLNTREHVSIVEIKINTQILVCIVKIIQIEIRITMYVYVNLRMYVHASSYYHGFEKWYFI